MIGYFDIKTFYIDNLVISIQTLNFASVNIQNFNYGRQRD